MFPDLVPNEEHARVVKTFSQAFEGIGRLLVQLTAMEEGCPGSLGEALAAEAGLVESQIDEAIKGLGRIKRSLQANRMHELAEAL